MAPESLSRREVLEVRIRLEQGLVAKNLHDELAIDEKLINDELKDQAAKYAWWATLHTMARGKRDELKRKLDLLEAELDGEIRRKLQESGEKATERVIGTQLLQTARYQKLQQQYAEAQQQETVLAVAREAFMQRKDMVVAIATNLRHELDAETSQRLDRMLARDRERGGR